MDLVNAAQTEAKVTALRECIRRWRPYGDSAWAEQVAIQLGLEAQLASAWSPAEEEGRLVITLHSWS